MKFRRLSFLAVAGLLLLAGCNFPGSQSAEQVQTAAAETVSAQQTQNALLTPSATATGTPTATSTTSPTPAVTNTPATTSSGGATGCDRTQFVSDVTVPDGEDHAPDTTFVKTWRLRNVEVAQRGHLQLVTFLFFGICEWQLDGRTSIAKSYFNHSTRFHSRYFLEPDGPTRNGFIHRILDSEECGRSNVWRFFLCTN